MGLSSEQEILVIYCNRKARKKPFTLLHTDNYSLGFCARLHTWEMDVNLPVPSQLSFNKNGKKMRIDNTGIAINKTLHHWSSILSVAIKTTTRSSMFSDTEIFYHHLLFCLSDGTVVEEEIGEIAQYKGVLGHLIACLQSKSDKIDE